MPDPLVRDTEAATLAALTAALLPDPLVRETEAATRAALTAALLPDPLVRETEAATRAALTAALPRWADGPTWAGHLAAVNLVEDWATQLHNAADVTLQSCLKDLDLTIGYLEEARRRLWPADGDPFEDSRPCPYKVTLRFGTDNVKEENAEADSTYVFPTHAELKAFEYGVDEGCGWLEYENVSTETPSEGLVRGAGWPVCPHCGEELAEASGPAGIVHCSDHCRNQDRGDPCPTDCEVCRDPETDEKHNEEAPDGNHADD
jgi:hypothetical protein